MHPRYSSGRFRSGLSVSRENECVNVWFLSLCLLRFLEGIKGFILLATNPEFYAASVFIFSRFDPR